MLPTNTSKIEEGSGTIEKLLIRPFPPPGPASPILLKSLVHEPVKGVVPGLPWKKESRIIPPAAPFPPKALLKGATVNSEQELKLIVVIIAISKSRPCRSRDQITGQ